MHTSIKPVTPFTDVRTLALHEINEIEKHYKSRLIVNNQLNRSVVSFQANKSEPIYRWFKYREGFSRELIEYCLSEINAKADDTILDPFAGTGASIFTAAKFGLSGVGIELMPVGCYFMEARQFVHSKSNKLIIDIAKKTLTDKAWKLELPDWTFQHLRITKGAFSAETELEISKYKTWLTKLNEDEAKLLDFVLFSVLEEISYTRKDGQYLRWDARSPRTRSTFNKGKIFSFDEAIEHRLTQIIFDLTDKESSDSFEEEIFTSRKENLQILNGTVFERLEEIENGSIDSVITSPPYCNRYDYTRTYALELAYLGVDEVGIRNLRQTLLTCTVENRPKDFDKLPKDIVSVAKKTFNENRCINAILDFLESEKKEGNLNNNGILSMVRGYFFDTAIHLAQASRKIKAGGYYLMVNDNVQYSGVPIPVDCILSSFAESVGFYCEKIWVLPIGKGNSSQQMKKHGRNELRKCVYVWRKCL
jgi:hypothetical protein